jgi:hypothetical protein
MGLVGNVLLVEEMARYAELLWRIEGSVVHIRFVNSLY